MFCVECHELRFRYSFSLNKSHLSNISTKCHWMRQNLIQWHLQKFCLLFPIYVCLLSRWVLRNPRCNGNATRGRKDKIELRRSINWTGRRGWRFMQFLFVCFCPISECSYRNTASSHMKLILWGVIKEIMMVIDWLCTENRMRSRPWPPHLETVQKIERSKSLFICGFCDFC